jgi:hypothetical protein
MGVLDSLIMTACLGASGATHDACQKSLQAGSKQSGVEQNIDTYESKVTTNAEKDTKEKLGETTVEILGGTAFLTKSVVEKHATIGLPNLGLCTYIKAQIGQDKSMLSLEWKF